MTFFHGGSSIIMGWKKYYFKGNNAINTNRIIALTKWSAVLWNAYSFVHLSNHGAVFSGTYIVLGIGVLLGV